MAQWEDPTPKYPVTNMFARMLGIDERGGLIIQHSQRVDQIEEECRYYRNWHPRNGMSEGGDGQFVARVPREMVAVLFRRGVPVYGDHDSQSEFVKWLNSEEARPWRTSNGGV